MQGNDTPPVVLRTPNGSLAVERPCDTCGTPFTVKPSWVNRGFHCSRECYGASRRTRVERTCEHCGSAFMVKPEKIAKGFGRYCSRACYADARLAIPFEDRLWASIDKDGPVPAHRPELGQCWVWTASRTKEGYGKIMVRGAPKLASHVVWESVNGPLKANALHHCDNPPCVRPDHLFDGTHTDNMRDASEKGRLGGNRITPRISDAERLVIRERYASGVETQLTIAQDYKVSSVTISRIIRGAR